LKIKTTTIAKALRKRSTDTENIVWRHLRKKQLAGIKFRRQQPIDDLVMNGFKVLRFWNNEVLQNLDGVLEVIRECCLSHPPLNPLPSREGID
jgi:very-short-patch-repair endonuclease